MTSIVDDLADCFADTLIAQPGAPDEFGDFVPSGEALQMPAFISGKTRMVVRDGTGEEVVSSLKVIVGITPALVQDWIDTGWNGWIDEDWINDGDTVPSILQTHTYRFTLPKRFNPREDLEAIAIGRLSDESGPHHEVVYLP